MTGEIQPAGGQPAIQPSYDYSQDVDATNGLGNPNANPPPAATQAIDPSSYQDTANLEVGIGQTTSRLAVNDADAADWVRAKEQWGGQYETMRSPVNFNAIPAERKAVLDAEATRQINRNSYGTVRQASPEALPTDGPREIDYNGFKNILTDLKNNKSYNDNEKAYIWSEIANQKGSSSKLGVFSGFSGGTYVPSINGSKPSVRDSDLGGLRAKDTPGHTVLSFQDGYHGFGVNGGKAGMGYMSPQGAREAIKDHETPRGLTSPLGFNRGDYNASVAMVDSFHAYRNAAPGHKFEAFANTWINGIVAK
jgi:hypothetical protein